MSQGIVNFLSCLRKLVKTGLSFVAVLTLTVGLVACSSAPRIERTATDTTVDLSGNWNDADSRMVATEMIQQMVDHPWYSRFKREQKKGGAPVVEVGTLQNRSSEHIETQIFVADIQRAMINSGQLRFMAAKGNLREVRRSRADQELNVRESRRKESGNELGADVALQGTISIQNDYDGRESVKFYQVDLTLTDIESGEMLWTGTKKIKKLVTKSRFR